MPALADGTAPAADRQVLVVGGGLGGLTTAAFLRQRGLSPVVVAPPDAARTRLMGPRIVLWSSALALLAELGVADDLRGASAVVRRWHLRGPDRSDAERLTSAHGECCPFVVVDPARACGVLRERIPAASVRLSKTPRRLDRVDGGVRVAFADGVEEQFDAVVGADGPRSWVRRSQADTEPPVAWGTRRWTARADGRLGVPKTVTELWTPDAALVCGPRDDPGRLQFVTTAVDESAPDAALRRLSRSFDLGSLPGRTVPSDLRVVDGHVDHTVRSDHWGAGRTALIGGAARPLPPALSVGPSLSVEDAYVLADELATAPTSAAALRAYARRRRRRHRTLGGHVPFDVSISDARSGALEASHRLHTALLRSFFAARVPAVSNDVARHL